MICQQFQAELALIRHTSPREMVSNPKASASGHFIPLHIEGNKKRPPE